MRKWAVILVGAISLVGCNSKPEPTSFVSPSGETIQLAKCGTESEKCMSKASSVCAGAYQVKDSKSYSCNPYVQDQPGLGTCYSLSYVCGKSDGKLPDFPFKGQQFNYSGGGGNTGPRFTNCQAYGNNVNCQQF